MDFLDSLGRGTKIFNNNVSEMEALMAELVDHDYIFLVRSDQMSVEIMGKDGELYSD